VMYSLSTTSNRKQTTNNNQMNESKFNENKEDNPNLYESIDQNDTVNIYV
jgi:hypothetical protein